MTRVESARSWSAVATSADGATHTVDISDASGLVTNAEIDPAGVPWSPGVTNPAGQPAVVLVSWVGGNCDKTTEIAIAARGSGLGISIQTAAGATCDAVGVPHMLRLSLTRPLPAASVDVIEPQ